MGDNSKKNKNLIIISCHFAHIFSMSLLSTKFDFGMVSEGFDDKNRTYE